VVFAITATAMVMIVGLLYSFGLVLAQRRGLQTAADAASLSGTWQVLHELASDNRSDANVLSSVVQYATSNGLPSDGTAADATYLSAQYVDVSGTALSAVGASGPKFSTSARGVRVSVTNQVPTVLPGFLTITQTLVQDTATGLAKPTTPPLSASFVIPIGVLISDARTAYAGHAVYDLFTHPVGGRAPTLDFTANGAPTFGWASLNEWYWSDGQHSGTWQLIQPVNVNLAGAAYYAWIAGGLHDNIRYQALPPDASGATYGLVTVPVYDTSTPSSLHIVGFAQMKLLDTDITSTNARGIFVPYAAAAWGTPTAPSVDVGAVLIGLSS
jgi:hypothetical protein